MPGETAARVVIWGGIGATALMSIGGLWDALMHTTRGHWFWAPPHLVIIATVVMSCPWAVTAAAIMAWLFFGLTGLGIEMASGIAYIVLPFPIIMPALALDAWYVRVWHSKLPVSLAPHYAAALATSTLCYGSLVGWSACMTRLPHQLSGGPQAWLAWYLLFVPVLSLPTACLSWHVHRHLQRQRQPDASVRIIAQDNGRPVPAAP